MKAPRAPRKALQAVKKLNRRLRIDDAAIEALHTHAQWLEPGRWIPSAANPKVWHHEHSTLPEGLTGPGGEAGTGRKVLNSKRGSPGVADVARWINGRRNISTTVSPSPDKEARATITFRPAGPANLLAIEPAREQAHRIARPGTYGTAWADVRRRLSVYLHTPAFDVRHHGAVLTEAWIPGPLLAQVPLSQQLEHSGTLLGGYAALARAQASEADDLSPGQHWFHKLVPDLVPPSLQSLLLSPTLRDLISHSPQIPSHGDLHPSNIVVAPQPTLIDLDACGWQPLWWDPAKLVTRLIEMHGARAVAADPEIGAALCDLWAATPLQTCVRPSILELAALHVAAWPLSRFRGARATERSVRVVHAKITRRWIQLHRG